MDTSTSGRVFKINADVMSIGEGEHVLTTKNILNSTKSSFGLKWGKDNSLQHDVAFGLFQTQRHAFVMKLTRIEFRLHFLKFW